MKVTILCSDVKHPVYTYLEQWCGFHKREHQISLYHSVSQIAQEGDILFLVSCSEIVRSNVRDLFRYTLVLHASDLPYGRGWSPHIWDVVLGKKEIILTLLDAEDSVDTGNIWQKRKISLDGTELSDEINQLLFTQELELMSWAVSHIDNSVSKPQKNEVSTYYRKRTPADSKLDPERSIKEQFNILRVSDPDRYPAFFIMNGQKYTIRLEKSDE